MRRGNRVVSRPSVRFRIAEAVRERFERDLERFSEILDPERRVSEVQGLKQNALHRRDQLGAVWTNRFCNRATGIVKAGLDEIMEVRSATAVAA